MMMMMSTSTSMTDCSSSSMQGSTTSSASSDVMTLTTTAASSWCAMPASTRLRVVRLVRPHQRRLLVVPNERSATFGFAVRGGKEHGIGFFVSHVEHGGEAQMKGLRIGDQILRINGYRLEDAVHKEFIQLVASQDRLTLKVRGVGMLPVKDQADERLSWSVVKLPSVSGTPSESSFKTTTSTMNTGTSSTMGTNERTRTTTNTTTTTASREINVVLHVAPRTKLGLGICKGPEWKPGIFVQFTKERSVAREAGLRPGDQILSVNSIDFSDVLFSEAVAVMKGSSKLDMVVRTAAGCDLFPGESSGYNSSASSVTGDQSPCWADAKSKRLTAVREEPINQQQSGNTGGIHKQLNKTIIKLTENGTSINNTYIANGNGNGSKDQLEHLTVSRSTTMRRSCSASAAAAPAPPPPAAMMNHSNGNECSGGGGGGGSSLSSAINEELKKRKEKQQLQLQQQQLQLQQQQQQVGQHGGATRCNSHLSRERERGRERDRDRDRDHRSEDRHNNNNNCNNINGGSRNVAQVSHKRERNTSATRGADGGGAVVGGATTATGDQHTALMDEFKRAHQRMFRNGFHESEHKERNETLKRTSIMPDDSCYRNNNTNTNTNHSNNNNNKSGNNSNSNNKIIGNINGSNRMSLLNGNNSSNNNNNNSNNANGTPELPPPPPQFANPLKLNIANGNASKSSKQLQTSPTSASTSQSTSQLTPTQPLSPVRSSPSINIGAGLRAPATPQPDYDAAAPVQLRSNLSTTPTTTATTTTNGSQQQRRTLRLGTVTIGEYGEQQRGGGKRETLRKIPSINGGSGSASGSGAQTNGILKNGNRSSASFNNNNNNGNSNGNSNRQQMQQLEKTIKFGN